MNDCIEIFPLTRIEGHGRISVFLSGDQVERVELALTESPRLFEAMLLGKSYREVPEIICRICSLCSTVHRLASLLAIEKALCIEVSEQTGLYRELILYGGQIQSHALHLFCLVLPDYYNADSISDLSGKAPDELKMGLRIKAAGNLLQETIGGRLIHPVTLIPGGMGKPPGRDEILRVKESLEAVLPETRKAFELFSSFHASSSVLESGCYMAARSDSGGPLFGNRLVVKDGEAIPAERYLEALREGISEGSTAKKSHRYGTPLVVGALARLNLDLALSGESAQAFSDSRDRLIGGDIHANNLAQAVELIHAVERSLAIIDSLLISGHQKEIPALTSFHNGTHNGTGSAAIEAPRGVLIHSYGFDNLGSCTAADIVTPTVINQEAMERDLLALARSMKGATDQEMTVALERLVRAYDPCISCAVHLLRI